LRGKIKFEDKQKFGFKKNCLRINTKDIFQTDKLNMNAAGYKIWREILFPKIKLGLKGLPR